MVPAFLDQAQRDQQFQAHGFLGKKRIKTSRIL
jgi:hypothetical protein